MIFLFRISVGEDSFEGNRNILLIFKGNLIFKKKINLNEVSWVVLWIYSGFWEL